jgi:hypothetical protein
MNVCRPIRFCGINNVRDWSDGKYKKEPKRQKNLCVHQQQFLFEKHKMF